MLSAYTVGPDLGLVHTDSTADKQSFYWYHAASKDLTSKAVNTFQCKCSDGLLFKTQPHL